MTRDQHEAREAAQLIEPRDVGAIIERLRQLADEVLGSGVQS
jgi:hypothetical protein